MKRAALALAAVGLLYCCGFDNTLREYLDARFWLPFAKRPHSFERTKVRRVSVPYAGMTAGGDSPLARLRELYRSVAEVGGVDAGERAELLTATQADASLTPRDREEVRLIDAKIEMRAAEAEGADPQLLPGARQKFEAFLATARTPELASEARGWLAHVLYRLGDQTAAGKIYLDELNRDGSNLSRETLLTSLQMTYGYDGGAQLMEHLEDYFDTPEHAAFAIQLATNPHWDRGFGPRPVERSSNRARYRPVKELLEKHAAAVPAASAIRRDPDFQWMLASSRFLSGNYAAAESPLLALFRSPRATPGQKAAAAYGLCGVYQKRGNVAGQLRYALWLHTQAAPNGIYLSHPAEIADMTVYWASSGWDLALLLDSEAPLEALQQFVEQNPGVPDIRLVRYSLAVRLTRENRYDEAAGVYQAINAQRRATRLRELAGLYRDSTPEGRYRVAEFLSRHPEAIYFNDLLWHGYQTYAMTGSTDSRLTRAERQSTMSHERQLKDQQEERWRAYQILREVTRDSSDSALRRKSALLAIECLDHISERFGRRDDIRRATAEMVKLLAIPRTRPRAAPAPPP